MKSPKKSPLGSSLRDQLGYLDDAQVAAFYGISIPTLKNRRSQGLAPPASKIGRDNLTQIDDIKADVARRRVVVHAAPPPRAPRRAKT